MVQRQIYGAEIARGIDVFKLTSSPLLSTNELDAALLVRLPGFNAQQQQRVTWPASTVVARAYLDQLTRSQSLPASRASEVTAALAGADAVRAGKARGSAAAVSQQLEQLSAQLDRDAAAANGGAAVRLRALADALKGQRAGSQ